MKRKIVLFVEGEGESEAAPRLIKKLLTEQNAWSVVSLDESPFRVGQLNRLVKDNYREWKRKLAACQKRKHVGAILLLLDGDAKNKRSQPFCAATAARALAAEAKSAGAGLSYSVGIVFARQEYESWLIGGVSSLAGKRLPDGRVVLPNATVPSGDLEESPRDAKGWFTGVVEGGYKPTRDQAALTDLVELDAIRNRQMRSFKRLESAVQTLLSAIRDGQPVVTPS